MSIEAKSLLNFHRVSQLAQDQTLVSVPRTCRVPTALALMRDRGFSCVPVKVQNEVVGVFSYRSLSEGVCQDGAAPAARGLVEDYLEQLPFVMPATDIASALTLIEGHDAVLVGTAQQTTGIVTAHDVAMFMADAVRPFALLEEIERTIRDLILLAAGDGLADCISRGISPEPGREKPPATMDDMTFGHYVQLVTCPANHAVFAPAFGHNIDRTRSELDGVRRLRNDIFHFRHGPGDLQSETWKRLEQARNWLRARKRISDLDLRGAP